MISVMAYTLIRSPKMNPMERQPKTPPINATSYFSFRKAKIPPSKASSENMIPNMLQTAPTAYEKGVNMSPRINVTIKDHPAMVRPYSGCV